MLGVVYGVCVVGISVGVLVVWCVVCLFWFGGVLVFGRCSV